MWAAGLSSLTFLSGVAALETSFGATSSQEHARISKLIKTFLVLWPIDEDIERAATGLSSFRLIHGMGPMDAIVAAQALRLGLPLATFICKHFRSIPGLVTVQPYIR